MQFCSVLCLDCWNCVRLLMLWFCFAVSDANVFVESELCDIAFPKGFFVLLVSFLRRCKFQVVSVIGALKLRLIWVFQRVKNRCWQSGNELKIRGLEWQLTRRLRQIRNARHFQFALNLVFTAQWFKLGGNVAHYLTQRYTVNMNEHWAILSQRKI